MLTISQIVNLTGASPQMVRHRVFTDQVPGATLEGVGAGERVVIPQSAYEAAVRAGVFEARDPDNHPGRPREARIPRLCANPACGLTFLVITSQAHTRGPFCSTECARFRDREGVLHFSDAGAYIAALRGDDKPLSRERVRQYVTQGRLPKQMTRRDIDAAFAKGELSPKSGVRGRVKAPEGFLTTADVAAQTGLTPTLISDLCARGMLGSTKARGAYLIPVAAFHAWAASAGDDGGEQNGAACTVPGAGEQNGAACGVLRAGDDGDECRVPEAGGQNPAPSTQNGAKR